MTNLDQFESAFNAADKAVFHPDEISIDRVLVVTDVDLDAARRQVEGGQPGAEERLASLEAERGDLLAEVGE